MSLFVLFLVAASSALHVFWNTLVKKCDDKVSFAWMTSMVACAALLPVFLLGHNLSPIPLDWRIWKLAALSGFFEACYMVLLFSAYRIADLSVVYPLSRGMAPLFIMLAGGKLLGDQVGTLSGMAVIVVMMGVTSISFSARDPSQRNWRRDLRGVLLALGTSCMIAGYQLVDRQAMRLESAPHPIAYLFLIFLFLILFLSVWVFLFLNYGRKTFGEWFTNRKGVLTVGICTPLAYFFIVLALCYGNVTYVAAGRNIGVLISVLVGALLLKEPVNLLRTAGASLIALGLAGLVLLT